MTLTATLDARTDRGPRAVLSQSRALRAGCVAFIGLVVGVVDLARHTAFTLDDWSYLRNARLDGIFAAGSQGDWYAARPVAQVIYAFVFGVVGSHPLPVVALVALVNLLVAVALWDLLEIFFDARTAMLTAVLWVIFANHSALEFWICCVNVSVALLLGAGGLIVGLKKRSRPGAVISAVLIALSMLSYQAVIPILGLAVVLLPLALNRKLDRRLIAWNALIGIPTFGWILLHWDSTFSAPGYKNFAAVVPAHFGWGIVPAGPVATVTEVIALSGVAVVAWLVASGRSANIPRAPLQAIGSGIVVIVAGLIPFVDYFYAPIGAGDRANAVTSIGGALIWAGLIGVLWSWRRSIAIGAVVLLVVGASLTRWNRTGLWHLAGCDADAVLTYVQTTKPNPPRTMVFYPTPPRQDNIAAYVAPNNITAAVQFAYDDPRLDAYFAQTATEFATVPPVDRVRLPDRIWCDGRSPQT